MTQMIDVQLAAEAGAFWLNAAFSVPAQGVTGVFGRSGSGKTTLLRCIAGLHRRSRGLVRVGEHTWQDDSSEVFVPVHRRRVGYVFQEANLFRHLNVRRNLEYGWRRTGRKLRSIDLEQAIEWLKLAPLLNRDPESLSGGERQRVAIARALAASPSLLLMDEPLSALDEAARHEVLYYLEHLPRGLSIPVVYVSHSVREMARLADRVVVMEAGNATETGPVDTVLGHVVRESGEPRDQFALLDAAVTGYDEQYGIAALSTSFGPTFVPGPAVRRGDQLRIQIDARDVSLSLYGIEDTSILNQLACRVEDIHAIDAAQAAVILAPADGESAQRLVSLVTHKSADALSLAPGLRLFAHVKSVGLVN